MEEMNEWKNDVKDINKHFHLLEREFFSLLGKLEILSYSFL